MNTLGPEAWTLPGQSPHFTKQSRFIIRPARLVTLSIAWLTEYAARATLRHLVCPRNC